MLSGSEAKGCEQDRMLANSRNYRYIKSREWIPNWLSKLRVLSLAIFCLVFAVSLEVLDVTVRRNHGLGTDRRHSNIVTAVKYLPTVGIVALGFGWKAIASDAKKVTPWAAMSTKWSRASDSVGVDYVTKLEPLSIYPSLRRKHWAVSVALVFSFVCGGLVAVANSLTFVDLFASHSEGASLSKDTSFSFTGMSENSKDGSLPIPLTHLGQQPYAAVAAERLPNGRPAPWTKDNFVFESITNTTTVADNSTLEASVKAFPPGFTCQEIEFAEYGEYIRANVSGRTGLNCSRDILLNRPDLSSGSNVGRLNVTACTEDQTDIRLVSSLNFRVDSLGNYSSLNVICTPHFVTRFATVRVNRTTGDIIDYSLEPIPSDPIDTHTSMLAIFIYLINPADTRTQDAFALDGQYHSVDDTPPTATWEAVINAVSKFYSDIDPFSSLLTDNLAQWTTDAYREDPEVYRTSVEGLANSIMAQTVNAFARENSSEPLTGRILTAEPKIFFRRISLRTLQAFLVLIALVCMLEISVLRPKTDLSEDPGSLAAIGAVLAASEREVEDKIARAAFLTGEETQRELDSTRWRAMPNAQGHVALETTLNGLHDPDSAGRGNIHGYSPLPLRLWAKLSVIIAISIAMVVLAILMVMSRTRDGLHRSTAVAADTFAFVPTVILLLLGYACSGIDGSVRTMAPYKSLWRGYAPTKQPLLYNLQDAPSIVARIRAIRHQMGLAVAASSFAVLLIPAVKIVAAGLYSVMLIQTERNIQVQVDTSLVNNVLNAFSMLNFPVNAMASAVERASQYAEWSMTPQFNVPVRSGILDNLIFSNLTGLIEAAGDIKSAGGEITVNVPALSVDVWCNTAQVGVRAEARNCSIEPGFRIEFHPDCTSAACDGALDGSSPYLVNGQTIANSVYATGGPDELDGTVGIGATACGHDGPPRLQGRTYVDWDLGYQALLVNWTNILGGIANTSAFDFSNADPDDIVPYISVTPSMINVSFPDMLAVKCYSNLTRVTVDAVFRPAAAASPSDGVGQNTTAPSSLWSPASYNASSIRRTHQYDRSRIPYWLAPHARYTVDGYIGDHMGGTHHYDSATLTSGLLESNGSLWPPRGASTSFWQLLAAYAEYELRDPAGAAAVAGSKEAFADAARAVYVKYATNLLTELRPYALRNLSTAAAGGGDGNASTVVEKGTIRYPEARIVQDFASTVALECLLGVMLLCFAWVALRFPNEAILPRSPGSIAARAALLARSRLVERLRGEGQMKSVRDAGAVWSEKAALGWWAYPPMAEKDDAQGEGSKEEENDEHAAEDDPAAVETGPMRVSEESTEGSDTEHADERSWLRDRDRQSRHSGEDTGQSDGSSSITQEGKRAQKPTLRWGIDVGDDVLKGRWTQLPSQAGD